MLRPAIGVLLVSILALAPFRSAVADLNTDIAAKCLTGGTVTVPENLTVTSTINLLCAPGTLPVSLVGIGAPSRIVCNTGANPCLIVGSTNQTNIRQNLSVRSLTLIGPGRATTGSVGVFVRPEAKDSTFTDLQVENFDVGILMGASTTYLLEGVTFNNLRIGKALPRGSQINTAIHMQHLVGNIHVTNFDFAAYHHIIEFDGNAGIGSGASFTEGTLNTTWVSGEAAVDVSVADNGHRTLQIEQVQDWETAVPFVDMGPGVDVTLNAILATGDPYQTSAYPAFHIAPNSFGALTITNSWLHAQNSGANLMKLEAPSALLQISTSRISGVMNFVAPTIALISSTYCVNAPTGNLANFHSSAGLGYCP